LDGGEDLVRGVAAVPDSSPGVTYAVLGQMTGDHANPSVVPIAKINDFNPGRRRLRDVNAGVHDGFVVTRAIEDQDNASDATSQARFDVPHSQDGTSRLEENLLCSTPDQKGMQLGKASVAERNQIRVKRVGSAGDERRHRFAGRPMRLAYSFDTGRVQSFHHCPDIRVATPPATQLVIVLEHGVVWAPDMHDENLAVRFAGDGGNHPHRGGRVLRTVDCKQDSVETRASRHDMQDVAKSRYA
jgi:hypothetical protein